MQFLTPEMCSETFMQGMLGAQHLREGPAFPSVPEAMFVGEVHAVLAAADGHGRADAMHGWVFLPFLQRAAWKRVMACCACCAPKPLPGKS